MRRSVFFTMEYACLFMQALHTLRCNNAYVLNFILLRETLSILKFERKRINRFEEFRLTLYLRPFSSNIITGLAI